MKFLDLLATAGGGGIFGSILHLGTSVFETWRKKKDAEVEIMVMNAKVAAAEKEAAWNAFAASQQGANGTTLDTSKMAPWASGLYACVNAFRDFTRPGLTWALLAVLMAVFFNSNPASQEEIAHELTFGSFTAIFWWFGSRYTAGKVK